MSLTETLLETQPWKFGLWPSVGRLLLLRVRIWFNGFKRSKTRSKIGQGVVLLLALGLMGGLFYASSALLNLIRRPELAEYIDPSLLIAAIPTLVLTGAFVATLLTNFGVLLQSLYLSRDMDFLITSPLPMRAVFMAKLLEAILPTFALFCAISLPVLFGLGSSNGYNLVFYPLLIVMLVLLAMAAGGLASILVMAVVRVVPAKRVAEVLGFVGAITSILCGQLGNLMNAAGVDRNDFGSALNILTRINTPWSPLAWAGQGLIAIGQGEWGTGLGLSVLSMGLAGLLFAGTLALAERLYYTGWSSMQGSVRKKRPLKTKLENGRRTNGRQPGAVILAPETASAAGSPMVISPSVRVPQTILTKANLTWLPSPMHGVIIKDFLLLRRDPRNLSQLITPMILGFVMLFTTRGGGRRANEALSGVGLQNLEVYGLIVLAIFVGWMLMFNLSTLAFSREGQNYWLLKTAPLRSWQLIASKYIVSYLPTLGFCMAYLLLAFAIQGMNWLYLPFCLGVVALSMAGATGISLAFGIAGANLDWDSPNRQRLSGSSGCLVVIAVWAYLLVDVLLFLLPPGLWQIFGGGAPLLAYGLGILLGGVLAAIAAVISLRLALPKLSLIGEA